MTPGRAEVLLPSLPDSLPVLSWSSSPRVFFSFGHQQLELTQAATSARWMSALMLGHSPQRDLSPYRIDRFLLRLPLSFQRAGSQSGLLFLFGIKSCKA